MSTFSRSLSHHASVARFGSDAGTRGPMDHNGERVVPIWIVFPVCASLGYGAWYLASFACDLLGVPR